MDPPPLLATDVFGGIIPGIGMAIPAIFAAISFTLPELRSLVLDPPAPDPSSSAPSPPLPPFWGPVLARLLRVLVARLFGRLVS